MRGREREDRRREGRRLMRIRDMGREKGEDWQEGSRRLRGKERPGHLSHAWACTASDMHAHVQL